MFKLLQRFREPSVKPEVLCSDEASPPSAPVAPWQADGEFIHEEQLDQSALVALFRRVMLPFEIDADSVVVDTESARVRVSLDARRKLVVIRTLWGFRPNADALARLQLANRLNAALILVRFSVEDEDVLFADYNLLYERGIAAFQLVSTVRRFALVARQGVAEYDVDNLIA